MKLSKCLFIMSFFVLMVCPFRYRVSFAASSDLASRQEIQVDVGTTLGSSEKISNFLGIQGDAYYFNHSNPDPLGVQAWRELGLNIGEICLFGGISVSRNAKGKLELDFTELETHLTYLTKTLGIKHVNFAIELMPQALSSKPNDENSGFYTPANYDEWEDVIYRSVLYLKDKLGFSGAHYQVWSEPESYCCFRGRPERKDNDAEILDDYVELYIHSCKAVKKADPTAKVGGPMTGTHSSEISRSYGGRKWGIDDFIQKVAKYIRQNPTSKVTLDEVVWQDYDWYDDGTFTDGVKHIQSVLKANGFPITTPQYLVGWNTGYSTDPAAKTLSQRAAYIAAMIVEQLNLGDLGLNRAYLWPFDSDDQFPNIALIEMPHPERVIGGEEGTQEGAFYGARQTLPAVTKICKRPAYAGLQMLAAMKTGQFIKATADKLLKDVQMMATRDNEQVMFIAVNNSDSTHEMNVHFSNLPYGNGSVTGKLRRVDDNHSADCQGLETGTKNSVEVKDGKLTLVFDMPPYSVAQINLER